MFRRKFMVVGVSRRMWCLQQRAQRFRDGGKGVGVQERDMAGNGAGNQGRWNRPSRVPVDLDNVCTAGEPRKVFVRSRPASTDIGLGNIVAALRNAKRHAFDRILHPGQPDLDQPNLPAVRLRLFAYLPMRDTGQDRLGHKGLTPRQTIR